MLLNCFIYLFKIIFLLFAIRLRCFVNNVAVLKAPVQLQCYVFPLVDVLCESLTSQTENGDHLATKSIRTSTKITFDEWNKN